jgi:rubredoxin
MATVGEIVSEELQADPATALWVCTVCGFVYDPKEGDEDGGIEPETPFEDIPAGWFCPVCGAMKEDFRKLEAGEEIPEFDMPGE